MEIKSKKVTLEPIEKLVSDPRNENKHSDRQLEALCKIINVNGFREPLIVSNRSGYVVCGNGRLEAAKRLGMTELPVIYQDFKDEADETRHRVASNEIARYAEFDQDKFLSNLEDLNMELESVDFEEMGLLDFKIPEIEKEKDAPQDTELLKKEYCPNCGIEIGG